MSSLADCCLTFSLNKSLDSTIFGSFLEGDSVAVEATRGGKNGVGSFGLISTIFFSFGGD